MNKRRPFVLIVEDDDDIRARVACAVRFDGYDVSAVRTTVDALAALSCDAYAAPHAIVANARLAGIHALTGRAPMFVVTTTRATAPARAIAEALGADAMFNVPSDVDALCAALRTRAQWLS
jgi:ActR/RegA family two-component response regulator